jgi:hypothetical protein
MLGIKRGRGDLSDGTVHRHQARSVFPGMPARYRIGSKPGSYYADRLADDCPRFQALWTRGSESSLASAAASQWV